MLVLGFKTCTWLNGLGVALTLVLAIGAAPSLVSPYWLRLPLALFLAGIAMAGLGLLWSGIVQGAMLRQLLTGRMRHSHWVATFLALICYALALLAFAAGCWATLGIASLSDYYGEAQSSLDHMVPRLSPQLHLPPDAEPAAARAAHTLLRV